MIERFKGENESSQGDMTIASIGGADRWIRA